MVSYANAHNVYGFSKVYANSAGSIDNAHNAGFDYDSIMYGISYSALASNQVAESNSGGRHVGSYFIDEPLERSYGWDAQNLNSLAISVAPKKIFLSSYKWPGEVYNSTTYGEAYQGMLWSGNVYLMCDEYHGNCLGRATEIWDTYYNYYQYYSIPKNISNWMHVVINNGTGGGHVDCPWINELSSDWRSLFDHANAHSINEVWLFAANTGNQDAVSSFCDAAWTKGWLLAKYQYVIINYRCDLIPACTKCSYPDEGSWDIEDITYTNIYEYRSY